MNTNFLNDAKQKGYLNNDLEIFYINDTSLSNIEYHYHDFYKMHMHLSGDLLYFIEGKEYSLFPGDTLLINPGEIHKPSKLNSLSYERIIVYLSEEFFTQNILYGTDLKESFNLSKANASHLIRLNKSNSICNTICNTIKSTFIKSDYGNSLLRRIKIQEYLIEITRLLAFNENTFINPTTVNDKIISTIDFINKNIENTLNINIIANSLYINPSYLMHLFKKETGYTIGKYINEKRLFLSNQYIQSGKSMTEACYLSGFQSYGTFYYSYKKKYGNSPKNSILFPSQSPPLE